MQNYPRKDGEWAVYIVQSLYEKDASKGWSTYSWVDKHDTREAAEILGYEWQDVSTLAMGKVWQESGIHGTLCRPWGEMLLRMVRRYEPSHAHRLVKMTVIRNTEVMNN
jgi:hypothetical protein